jgi:hypothetical protein
MLFEPLLRDHLAVMNVCRFGTLHLANYGEDSITVTLGVGEPFQDKSRRAVAKRSVARSAPISAIAVQIDPADNSQIDFPSS